MKINELGDSKKVNEGVGNWLARKGAFGAEKGMAAQDEYMSGLHQKDFTAKLQKAYKQAVEAGIVNVNAGAQGSQPQTQTPQQDATAGAYDNLSPEEKQKVDAAKQRRDAAYTQAKGRQQKGPIVTGSQAETGKVAPQKAGTIMSNDPDAKAKLAALPPRTQGNATAQDAAARAGLTPNTDPRRNAAYTQAKNRQGTAGGPVVTGTAAAKPMTGGPTGGTQSLRATGPSSSLAQRPVRQTKRLDKPLSDQDLRNIEANRQRMKEDVLEGAYSEFDALIESIVSEAPQAQGMSPGKWLVNYINQQTEGSGIDISKFKGALSNLGKEFNQNSTKSQGIPADIAKKVYSFYSSSAASSPKQNKHYNSTAGSSNKPATNKKEYIEKLVEPVIQSGATDYLETIQALIGMSYQLVQSGKSIEDITSKIASGVTQLQQKAATEAQQQQKSQQQTGVQ